MSPADPRLGRLVILAAYAVPSEAAAPMASLELRALRAAWLDALADHGLTEETARRLASTARLDAIASLLQSGTAQ